jgi:hypothetical protein
MLSPDSEWHPQRRALYLSAVATFLREARAMARDIHDMYNAGTDTGSDSTGSTHSSDTPSIIVIDDDITPLDFWRAMAVMYVRRNVELRHVLGCILSNAEIPDDLRKIYVDDMTPAQEFVDLTATLRDKDYEAHLQAFLEQAVDDDSDGNTTGTGKSYATTTASPHASDSAVSSRSRSSSSSSSSSRGRSRDRGRSRGRGRHTSRSSSSSSSSASSSTNERRRRRAGRTPPPRARRSSSKSSASTTCTETSTTCTETTCTESSFTSSDGDTIPVVTSEVLCAELAHVRDALLHNVGPATGAGLDLAALASQGTGDVDIDALNTMDTDEWFDAVEAYESQFATSKPALPHAPDTWLYEIIRDNLARARSAAAADAAAAAAAVAAETSAKAAPKRGRGTAAAAAAAAR